MCSDPGPRGWEKRKDPGEPVEKGRKKWRQEKSANGMKLLVQISSGSSELLVSSSQEWMVETPPISCFHFQFVQFIFKHHTEICETPLVLY